jgi:predicted acyl esterase
MIGTSYAGSLVLVGLVNPHPALKAAVAINPMVDTWIGDDWFHRGAFRQMMIDFIGDEETSRDFSETVGDGGNRDDYELYLRAGSAGELGHLKGLDQVSFWRNLLQHPAYDAFWQGQALDKILAGRPLKAPTMYIHGLWDQEDIYGSISAYEATPPSRRLFSSLKEPARRRRSQAASCCTPNSLSGFRNSTITRIRESRMCSPGQAGKKRRGQKSSIESFRSSQRASQSEAELQGS